MEVSIRPAEPRDGDAVAAIFNQGIEERQATFETRPQSAAYFADGLSGDAALPFLVAEEAGGRVVAWARLTPYSSRGYYSGVTEVSIYVERGARGAGVARRLLEAIASEAERRGVWKLIGLLFPENRGSVTLFRAAGYRDVGVLRRHGRLEGRWRDVLLVERSVGEGQDPAASRSASSAT